MRNLTKNNNKTIYDVTIIGGGPAGIAASIQAARLGLRAAIIERNRLGGEVNIANLIENFPGSQPLSGKDFIKPWIDHLKSTKIDIIYDEAIEILPPLPTLSRQGRGKKCIKTANNFYKCDTIIIATGAIPKKINIPNALYYADPDLVEHEGKDIIIIGGGDAAFDQALNFSKRAKNVLIVMRGGKPKALEILVKRAKEKKINIITEYDLTSINISADLTIACIGKETKSNLIDIKNPPHGVFVAGDCYRTSTERHIAIAVKDGTAAAIGAFRHFNFN
ncbi:MAG: NAD(P)/FAD-dependent oxidoreductase [Pseudomonadota bacterium]